MLIKLFRPEPTLQHPVSQAVTQSQFHEPVYAEWCRELRETPRYHRKQWEFVYLLQVLRAYGALKPRSKGIGYGVGTEPLPDLLASYGCEIMASDLDLTTAQEKGWVDSDQHAAALDVLNSRKICDPDLFRQRVTFRVIDMNDIPRDLEGYDFTWSACCLEHLGSIKHGLDFIENSLRPLRSGGIAVHTTELNCSSDTDTLDNSGTVLFRRKDIRDLANRLKAKGHVVAPLNFNLGRQPLDKYVDVPPYTQDRHLKLRIGLYDSTSFGIVVRKM